MSITDILDTEMPTLSGNTTIENALALLETFSISELPLTRDNELLGVVKEELLLDSFEALTINDLNIPAYCSTIAKQAHLYEAATIMADNHLSLLPVLDERLHYAGIVTQGDVFNALFKGTALAQPGGIMVLTMQPHDYSLSEVARICEGCDTTILNVQIFNLQESGNIEVVLKTNKKDLQVLKNAFERHEYNIKALFGDLPSEEELDKRYQFLMDYINM